LCPSQRVPLITAPNQAAGTELVGEQQGKGRRFCSPLGGLCLLLSASGRSCWLFICLFLPHRFFALTSLRLVFLVAFTLIVVVCIDKWKNKIWPEIGVARPDDLDNER
uniref:RETREG1-3/ARL6IP-like N-terminal reticulon-homology domain-containing protein n=1 Tax=Anas platyrhynchos platyrhynchos TaxID=8840 RepID=A0A493U3J3_ANAPP